MHNVLIGQKGHKTKEERGKGKEKEKDGKKYKRNNIYNHSNVTTRGEHAHYQQDASSFGQSTNNQHMAGYHSQKHKRGGHNIRSKPTPHMK